MFCLVWNANIVFYSPANLSVELTLRTEDTNKKNKNPTGML